MVEPEQVTALQEHKNEPANLDYTTNNYQTLIEIDWDALRWVPEPIDEDSPSSAEQGTGPIEMSQQELLMSNEVEELSDEMKLEQQMELKQSLGKTSLAFLDLQEMSAFSKVFYLVAILSITGIVFNWFY